MGKLFFMADNILTGTLAEIGGTWDKSLRLVNVQDREAIPCNYSVRTPLFRPTELRDASAFNEDFERMLLIPHGR